MGAVVVAEWAAELTGGKTRARGAHEPLRGDTRGSQTHDVQSVHGGTYTTTEVTVNHSSR